MDLDEISHAHIIVGENGIGKSKLANKLARYILGKSEEKDYIESQLEQLEYSFENSY